MAAVSILMYVGRLNDFFAYWTDTDRESIPSLDETAKLAHYIHDAYDIGMDMAVAVALYDFFQTRVPTSYRPSGTQSAIADFYGLKQCVMAAHYRYFSQNQANQQPYCSDKQTKYDNDIYKNNALKSTPSTHIIGFQVNELTPLINNRNITSKLCDYGASNPLD